MMAAKMMRRVARLAKVMAMGRMALLEKHRVEGRVERRGEGGEHGKVTWGRSNTEAEKVNLPEYQFRQKTVLLKALQLIGYK